MGVAGACVVGPADGEKTCLNSCGGVVGVVEAAHTDAELVVAGFVVWIGASDGLVEVHLDSVCESGTVAASAGFVDEAFELAHKLANDGDFHTLCGLLLGSGVTGAYFRTNEIGAFSFHTDNVTEFAGYLND